MGKKKPRRIAGRYDILRSLGEGTTGTTYLVADATNGAHVVLKVPRDDLAQEIDLVRFQRAYGTMSQVDHAGIVRILEVGPSHLVSAFVPGDTIASLAGEPVHHVLDAGIELVEILAALHQHGLIHRRIHPGNLRFDGGGHLVLLDFGFPLARGFEPGLSAGESPLADYMAPEVLRGFEVDPRADVYSTGIVLYELVTGKRPPAARDLTVRGAADAEIVPPSRLNKDVTPGFEKILLAAMARDPADRFQSAEELLNELIFLSGKSEIARIRTEKGRRFLLPPRFVGQDGILAAIDAAWETARGGRARAVLVHGSRGLGKSRILREARARCMAPDTVVLEVDCEEASGGPLAPLVAIVRQLLVVMEKRRPHRIGDAAGRWGGLLVARIPDLAKKSYLAQVPPAVAISDPEAARELLELTFALIERDALVLLVDNLHAAHELSGRFVYELLSRGKNGRVLVVATRRVGGDEAEDDAASRLLPRLRSEGLVVEHQLEPLSSEELAAFVGSMVGRKRLDGLLVERIEEVTSGVPRLAEETMGNLADEGLLFRRGGVWQIEIDDHRRIQRPRLAEDRVLARLEELGGQERRILTVACVLGDRVDPTVVADLSGVAGSALEAALERLAEIGFLDRSPGPGEAVYGVAGREARRKVLAEMDRKDRERLHGEAAVWMESAGRVQSDEDLEAIAYHLENSGDPGKAIRWLVKAGDRARRTVAVDRAISLFERALALAGEDDPAQSADILGKLGSVYSRAGRFDQAVNHYTRALQTARGDARGAAFFLMGLGYAYYRKNKHTDALHCFNQLLTSFGDNGVRPEVLTHISRTYLAKGNLKKSEEVCLEALELAKGLERGRVEAAIRNQLGEIRWVQGRWTQSLECQAAALDLLPEEGEYFLKSRIAHGIARVHLGRGDRERCYKYLEDALYEAQTCGDQAFAAEVQNHIGEIFERSGEFDRAQEIYVESTRMAERLDQQPVVALGCLNQGRLLVKRGRTAEAVEHLTRARRLFRDCRLPWGVGASYLHLGEAFVLDRRSEKAKTSFALAERSLRDVQMKWMLGYVYCGVAAVFVSEGQFDTALKMLNKALGQSKEYQDPVILGRAHREYAAFCLATDRRDVAVEHFVRSQMVLDEVGARFELARTHLEYGRYLLGSEKTGDRGNLKSAVNHLRKARDLLALAGETIWTEKVVAALKECERERINVHRRDDLTQAARELLDQIQAFEESLEDLIDEVLAELAEQGKHMDAASIRDEVEKRLAKRLKEVRAKQDKILGEIEDLREERNSLWSLQQIAGEMNAVHDSGQVFGMATDMMLRVIRAERGALLLKGEGGAVQFQGGQGLSREEFETPDFDNARAVVAKVIANGEPTITRDGGAASNLEGKAPDPGVVRSTLCVPLAIRENPIGALFAQGAAGGPRFADRDLDLFAGFAKQVAVALENAFLYEELNAKQKLEQELNLAHRIQAKLLPKTIPQVPGIEVFGRMIPAGKVGGDYYDFITDGAAKNLILCIGDVSGKGMPGGLVMVMARVLLHYFDVADQSTRDVLLRANEILKANTEPFMFMSMLLLKWESEAKRLTYTGAGHENLLIFRSREEEVEVVPAGGVVLGIKDDISGYLTEKEIGLDPGDAILLYTDGCTEAQNSRGEMFELENLTRSFGRHAGKDVAEICDGVIGDLKKFIGTAEQHDDITVTVLKRAL